MADDRASAENGRPDPRPTPVGRTWRTPIGLVAAALLLLSGCRLATWLLNPADFAGLSAGDAALAFLRGLRFDLCISLIVLALPALLLALPLRLAASRGWRVAWSTVAVFGLALLAVVAIADVVYFGWSHRHLGQEIRSFFRDPVIARALLEEHGALLAVVLAAIAGVLTVAVLQARRPAAAASGPRAWAVWIVVAAAALLGIRGTVSSKPLQVVNAFAYGQLAEGMLALNGPFALAKTLDKGVAGPARLMASPEAIALTGRFLGTGGEFPLDRSALNRPLDEPAPNVVILLLESWGSLHIDACRAALGLPPEGLTPGFDRLAREGLFFTRFHANGQRSMEGMAALLAGVPTVPGFPYIGEGLEQSRMRYLGGIARENGYRTLFMQGSWRSSYRMDAVTRLAGFDEYAGAEDIPYEDPARPPAHAGSLGAHDGDLLAELVRRTGRLPEPYLAVAFTLSTHGPVRLPEDRWRTSADTGRRATYLDALRYSDWAVARCVDAIRARARAPGGRRAIVVVLADHASGLDAGIGDPLPRHRIPLLILDAPGGARTIDTVGSQVDVIPTLMGLCGWSGAFSGLGKDLLSDDPARAALCVRGDLTSLIGPGGWIVHDGRARIATEGDPESVAGLEALLPALQQTVGDGLARNRVLAPVGVAAGAGAGVR